MFSFFLYKENHRQCLLFLDKCTRPVVMIQIMQRPSEDSKNRRYNTCGSATRKEEKKMKKMFCNLVPIS